MTETAKPNQKTTRPSILHCPVSWGFESCDPAELEAIVSHLQADQAVKDQLVFPRGTHLQDGRLDLCKQCIGPTGAEKVAVAVANNHQTKHWLLGANGLGNEGAKAVAAATKANPNLETVYLGCNLIEADGAKALTQSLHNNDHITGLWLKRNPIGVEGAQAIVEMLQQNQCLRTLDLVHTRIGSEGIRLVVSALTQPETSVRRLYLGGNEVGPQEAAWIAEMLAVNRSIHSLYLSVNRLRDTGVGKLAEGVRQNQTLTAMSVSSNAIGAGGAWALAERLQNHPSLRLLDVGYDKSTNVLGEKPNHYGDEGAFAFADYLETNPPLRQLDLRKSGITTAGAQRLLQSLDSNSNLTRLVIGGGIAHSIKRQIQERMEHNAQQKPEFVLPDYQDIEAIKSVYRS